MTEIVIMADGNGSNIPNLIRDFNVIAVISRKACGAIEIAKSFNINTFIVKNDKELKNTLQGININLIVLTGYMKLIPKDLTNEFNIINIHPSLLPLHKGIGAMLKTFEDENIYGGVTIHRVNEELDSGDILMQIKIKKDNMSWGNYKKTIKQIEHNNYSILLTTLIENINTYKGVTYENI